MKTILNSQRGKFLKMAAAIGEETSQMLYDELPISEYPTEADILEFRACLIEAFDELFYKAHKYIESPERIRNASN